MYTTFHIKADELDETFLKKLKAIFKKKTIIISVEEDIDETEYLLASENNRKMLLSRMKDVQEGKNLVPLNLKDL